jgi:hypothetical protein
MPQAIWFKGKLASQEWIRNDLAGASESFGEVVLLVIAACRTNKVIFFLEW